MSEITRLRIACVSAMNPSRPATDHTMGATMSQKARPSSMSPAIGRALSSAWNSQFFAHFS